MNSLLATFVIERDFPNFSQLAAIFGEWLKMAGMIAIFVLIVLVALRTVLGRGKVWTHGLSGQLTDQEESQVWKLRVLWVLGGATLLGLVAFGVFVTLLNRLIGLVFTIFDRVFNFVKLVPGIGTIDRLGGAALGFLEGALTIGITVFFATKIDVSPAWVDTLKHSTLVPIFTGVSNLVVPLLPGAMRSAQSVLTKTAL